ncbi:TRAP transporter small permease [Amorphus sp. 3PC139-8]|uniref:TRAP transporter small permease n=1 Tax=Amorphus sp. 3PC139-8 TaxID=2735676 RepID=UPI00345DAAB1
MSRITAALAAIGVCALMAITLITVGDAILRTYFTSPVVGVSEVAELLALIAIASFLPLSLEARHHLSIDFLAEAFGRHSYRWLGVFGALLTLVFFSMMVWQLLRHSLDLLSSGASTWFLAWPVGPWWLATTAILFLCIPVQILVVRALLTEKGAEHSGATASEDLL